MTCGRSFWIDRHETVPAEDDLTNVVARACDGSGALTAARYRTRDRCSTLCPGDLKWTPILGPVD